jgi:hypothetical protein
VEYSIYWLTYQVSIRKRMKGNYWRTKPFECYWCENLNADARLDCMITEMILLLMRR